MAWRPTTKLEEEIVARQPNNNFIFGHLTNKIIEEEHLQHLKGSEFKGQSLSIMREVAEMTGRSKESVKLSDWDHNSGISAEQEITGMIRACGMSSSKDVPLEPMAKKATQSKKSSPKHNSGAQQQPKLVLLGDDDFKIVSTRMRNRNQMNNMNKEDINALKLPPLKCEKEYANFYKANKERQTATITAKVACVEPFKTAESTKAARKPKLASGKLTVGAFVKPETAERIDAASAEPLMTETTKQPKAAAGYGEHNCDKFKLYTPTQVYYMKRARKNFAASGNK